MSLLPIRALRTPGEAARFIGVCREQVYRLIATGPLVAHLYGRRDLRITPESIETLCEQLSMGCAQ